MSRRTRCSVGCPSLLRWSFLHHNLGVIHHLSLLSLFSAAVVSPGSWRCWLVAAPPLLVGSAGVQRGNSWTSAVASPRSPSLGLDLWVSCVAPPLCARSLQMQVHIQAEGAVPCGADGGIDSCAAVPSILTDRRSICFACFHLCLFHFVKCPWVP